MEELKEGTIICSRELNISLKQYIWTFEKVKKITPSGKIRLENGDLLSSLGSYSIYDDAHKRTFNEDKLKGCLRNMIYYMNNNKDNIINNLSIEDVIAFGTTLDELKIEDTDRWGRNGDKESYQDHLKEFIELKNILK